jgi:hypothetical protein
MTDSSSGKVVAFVKLRRCWALMLSSSNRSEGRCAEGPKIYVAAARQAAEFGARTADSVVMQGNRIGMAREAKVRLHDYYRTDMTVERWQADPLVDGVRELI